jgi:hypothetical protein
MESVLVHLAHHVDSFSLGVHHLPLDLMQVFNEDILGDFQKAFNNFVQTGQVWAMIIGFAIGYILKSLLSY